MDFKAALKSFFKIGIIGFGGGTALIPVMEKELVEEKKIISPEQFKEDMVLQGITPGAFPLKIGVAIGLEHSAYGGVSLAYLHSMFGGIIAIFIITLLTMVSKTFLTQINYLSVGISVVIVLIISKFIARAPKSAKADKIFVLGTVLILFTFIFSGFSEVMALINLFTTKKISFNFPELSSVTVLILGFNFATFTKLRWKTNVVSVLRYFIAIVITVLSVLTFAERPVISNSVFKYILYAIIALMFIYTIIMDVRKTKHFQPMRKSKLKRVINCMLITLAPMVVITIICVCLPVNGEVNIFGFIGKGIVSVVTTFGGGSAYISVSESVFVGEYATAEYFWGQVVPVCNSLPGPLLVKMLATIGFGYVHALGASVGVSICFAVLGMILGITSTIVSFLLIMVVFEVAKGLSIFTVLIKSVLPLIAGLLVPTLLSLIKNMLDITLLSGISAAMGLVLVSSLALTCSVGMFKFKINEPILLVIFGVVSIAFLNLISLSVAVV